MSTTHIYLASPYSHKNPKVMDWRYRQAVRAAAACMSPSTVVFSPIAHSHEIGLEMRTSTDHEFWLHQDLPWLERADELWVLCLDGWATSRGVNEEIAYAKKLGKVIKFLQPSALGLQTSWREPFEPEVTQTFGTLPLGEQLKADAEAQAEAARAWREHVEQVERDFNKQIETMRDASVTSGGTGGSKLSNPKDIIGVRKAPLSCVPMNVIAEIGVGMLEGATRYGRHNYRAVGVRSSVYFDATMRHLVAYWEGEDVDPDSGVNHLAKALTSLVVWRDAQMQGMCEDDRPPRSAPFYTDLNARAGAVVDRNADKTPHHYTIKDAT